MDVIRFLFRITLAEVCGQDTSVCEGLPLPGYEDACPPSPPSTVSKSRMDVEASGEAEQPHSEVRQWVSSVSASCPAQILN